MKTPDYFPVVNDSGEQIPAWAVMRVTRIDEDGAHVDYPDSSCAGHISNILINGESAISAQDEEDEEDGGEGFGNGHRSFPAIVAYDTTDGTPVEGEVWGIESGNWRIVKKKAHEPGFYILGGPVTDDGTVNVSDKTGGRKFYARVTDRDAVTCDTGSSGSQSGSNDTDYTYYRYAIHSVHAVDDGHGCPAWVNDEADVAIISDAVYELNGNTVAVGTVVEVESVTYTDESQSGSEAESGSNSGSDNIGPAGCRLVFSHEGEPDNSIGQCFTVSSFTATSLDCQNNYFKRKVYQTIFGPSLATGCWGLGPAHLVATFTTTWCCNPCGTTTNNSGSESGGDPETCDPCDGCGETYCLTLDTSPPAMQCGYGDISRAMDGKTVEMTNIQCQGGECECQSTWEGETTFEWDGYHTNCGDLDTWTGTTTIWARLYRFCQCEGTYIWALYAGQVTKRNGNIIAAAPFIMISATDGYAPYALGTNASPTTPAATSGPIYGASIGGTFALAVGACPGDSGSEIQSGSQSGSDHAGDCPCQHVFNGVSWIRTVGGPECTPPGLIPTPFTGEVRNGEVNGSDCDDGPGSPGPTCASCGTADRTATPSGGTGFLSAMTSVVPLTYQNQIPGGGGYWNSNGLDNATCGAGLLGIAFWCENNRWYCTIIGSGIAFEANAGNTCASMTFTLIYDGSNTLCPGMNGRVTVTVTT